MLKGNGSGAKEGTITLCTKPEPGTRIKFFLCVHGISAYLKWEETLFGGP